MPQSYQEIIDIIQSYDDPKGLTFMVKPNLWGESYASSAGPEKVTGVADRWKTKGTILMIKWQGYQSCRQQYLVALENDEHGASLELELLPFTDGTIPTKQVAAPPPPPPPPPPPQAQRQTAPAGGQHQDTLEQGQQPAVVKHGQTWWHRNPTSIKEDARAQDRSKPRLNTAGRHLPSMMSLFLVMLPPAWVEDILKYTNVHFDDSDPVHKKMTKGELLRFFGYMLILTLQDYLPLDKMWQKTSPPGTSAPPPAMGRFGMSQNRFMAIKARLRFGPEDDDSFAENEWCFVEKLVTAFNDHMYDVIIPGWLLAPDESMFAWRGKVGKRDRTKCPHRMFVRRKPEPLGVELKNIGDALSGIILSMEIVKGKAEIVKPKYYTKERGATAATTMRLAEKWFGTSRCVAGDSWFGSFKGLKEMLLNGLHGIFDVKTGTNSFPLHEIQEATGEENGAWATMTSEVDINGETKQIYACSHRRGDSVHAFVASCSTTLLGDSVKAYFEDDEERAMGEISEYEVCRKAAKVHNDFTLAQPTIGRHNRYRQQILAMEKRFVTNNFSFGFFTSMLGTLIVNVFMAHRYFNDPKAEFKVELDKLGLALVNNVFIEPPSVPKSPSSHCATPGSDSCDDGEPHYLIPLRSVEGIKWKNGMQRRCRLCSADTVWVCGKCTAGPLQLWPICPEVSTPRKGTMKGKQVHHPCLSKHRLSPDWVPRCKKPGCGTKRKAGNPDAADPDECHDAEEDEADGEEEEM